MHNIEITESTLEDVDTLWRWGEENRQLWASEHSRWYSKKALRSMIENPGDDIFIIARGGKNLIGMCLTRTLQEWAYIESLFVRPDFRRQGIGEKLVAHTISTLKRRNIKNVSLQPEEHNLPAISFYKKLGFSEGFRFIWMDKKI